MSRYPERDKYTRWRNELPIVDLNEALYLLAMDMRLSVEVPYLTRRQQEAVGEIFELVVPWYTHGDSGGDQSGYYYFQIDQDLARKLVMDGLVQPTVVKYWGGSHEETNKLVISPSAHERHREFETEMLAKAETLLKPGLHTDLTGRPCRRYYGLEHQYYGRFYVEFEMPNGKQCRVYPGEDILIAPYPPKSVSD